ncbi:DMT family transporter [Desulfuribacillus alkaliarsenatis]|uniref:Multidrug transporter n=1 Tax=Desulfuribacillus alkaliarsenatis TaxID=766136 RepID=A0A1E5G267_9FIRM|nr:DMT family transporter [Desulfuribacillus alkaliarsenatis]OEF96997.1 multidrug transporter [Desulfuribacillus alkaliarsenatis]
MNKQHVNGYLLAFLTVLIWGTTYIFTKNLLNHLSPFEILMYRFLIAYGLLLLIYPKFDFSFAWKVEGLFFLLGLLGVTSYFLLENIALSFTQASNVGLIVSAIPLFAAIVAHFMHKDERFQKDQLFGFMVAITGIFLVIFNGAYLLDVSPTGDLLALLCAVIWAVYSNLLKKVDNSMSPILMARKTFFYGILTMTPIMLFNGVSVQFASIRSMEVIGSILFLALLASILAFVMWNKAIKLIGSVKTTTFIYLVPLITMVSSAIFLKEQITGIMIIGAVLILFGVHLGTNRTIAKP